MTAQFVIANLLSFAAGAAALWALRAARRRSAIASAQTPASPPAGELAVVDWLEHIRMTARDAGSSFWVWDLARDEVRIDARSFDPGLYNHSGDLLDRRRFLNELLHPEDRTSFIRAMENIFASNCLQFTHHYRMRRPDGAIAHLKLYGRVERDAHGRALRLIALNQDVTEQALIAAKLEARTQEQTELLRHLRLANRTAGVGAWKYDIVADCFTPDTFVAQALGVPEGDIRNARAFLLNNVLPDDRNAYLQDVDAAIASGAVYLSRYRTIGLDGSIHYMQAHAHIERDAAGAAVRMLGVTMDVTANTLRTHQLERQTEDERTLRRKLDDQAAQVQTFADRITVAAEAAGLYVWEMDAVTRQFLWVGNRMRAFGLEHTPLAEYGATMAALIEPEDFKGLMAEAEKAYADGRQTYSYRFRMTRDGITRHMATFAHIVRDEHGAAVRLVGATTDITNEVQTTALLQRQAAQERQLIDRLHMATQAAGISSWEIDLAAGCFLWLENPLWSVDDNVEGASVSLLLEQIAPEDRDNFTTHMRATLKKKQDRFAYRYRVISREAPLHVQNHVRLILDENGVPLRALGVSWDITREVEAAAKLERQTAEQRRLLERLKLSTEAAAISCWEVNLDTRRFAFYDDSIVPLHGVDKFSGTTDEFFASIHPEDSRKFLEHVRESVMARRDRFSCRYRMPRPEGRFIHIQTHVHVMIDDTGRGRRLLGVSWDITKEIEAAERLQDAERRLERASLSSLEGHWEYDVNGARMWFSSSYHKLLGYADGELPRSAEFFSLIPHPEDRVVGAAAYRNHIENNAPYQFDCRLKTKSGEYRWFRQRGTAERDADGKPTVMSGSIQEVHEQKLAENALREAQSRFERAINGTQDGLWELDHDGAAWCSPRIGELLGFGPDELSPSTNFLRSFLHPDDAPQVAAATQSHYQNGEPYDVEIRLRTKDREYRWYRARATAERDAGGRPLRLSGSLQDVTEARAAREALMRATEAAEAANRAKSEFLANVSHEIRTPLNGVIGMTGLLLDTTLDRTQRDYADTIRTSADSLLMVINDILDFSKIEAGKLDIESIEFDLHGVIEDVGGMMAFQAAAKHLELIVHIHPDVPARVLGDAQRVRQCLMNLLGNAIKFTRVGEIVIEVRRAESHDGRPRTRIEVRDTGIGIAAETLKTLFQPFVQADSSTTRHFGGTGLGLSIVRRLVELMGGSVGAASQMGVGSSFWFTLPLAAVEQTDGGAAVDLTRLGRRVLVVDDNETNRRVLAGQLMRAGYEVSLASGGVEALSLLRQALADEHPFEAVLADYKMHDMDGAVLGERVHGDPALADSRMIMLTSMDRDGDIQRFASLGFAAYLTKPVRARELLDCLGRVLARDAREWHLQSQPIVTRSTLAGGESARRYDCRVLLVEDNPVNQKVAVRFLQRMGCSVRVADNGAEGLKAFHEATCDIVLMDLQMPVMDGLTATRRIREQENPERRTPIIALTANAMSGQLERCLAAGMDGFLTKPIDIGRLHETLERYGLGGAVAHTSGGESSGLEATPVQLARLNELTEGDPEFAHELALTFVASGAQVLDEIHSAFKTKDRSSLSRAAHKLKGASANIHAEPLRDLAQRLETEAAQLDQPRLAELIEELRREFERAGDFLKATAPEPAKKAG